MFKNLLKSFQGGGPAARPEPSSEEAQRLVAQGNAAEDAGRVDEALALYERAAALAPQLPAAHLNRGIALEALGRAEAARACYAQVLALAPGHPFGAYNLGKLDYLQGNLRSAEALLRQAIAGKADFHNAWVLLANVLEAQGALEGAARAMEQAMRLLPDHPGALYNQSGILRQLGRLQDAEAAAARAAQLDPGNADYLLAQCVALVLQGLTAEGLEVLRRARALAPRRTDLQSRELFLLNHVEGVSAEEIWQRHRAFGAQLEAQVPARAHGPSNADKPRLRLGFVSGELRTHPVALFLLPLLERLDRGRFSVTCYSSTPIKDAISQRLQGLCEGWVDALGWTDAELAARIEADGIDLLVDLDGHTSQTRVAVFAARPAPVQLAWVGYLNTSGLTRIDYRLTDVRCDPPAVSQPLHTEGLLFLPHSQWCYRPFLEVAAAGSAPCERNGFVTFGSLNNATKLTTEHAQRWGRILKALPTARLLVAGVTSERKRQSLLDAVAAAGGSPERVRFAPRSDLEGYYRLMDQIDIALDSFPYGGGTTTFDALWMGVPVLTATGPLPASRSAASVLAALGLAPWIAAGIEGFEALAIERAKDTAAIAQLRRTLRDRLRTSPLMDERGFVAAFEAALQQAWRERAASSLEEAA